MARFSIYRNPRPKSRLHAPFLLDVQSDLVSTRLRVVIPLIEPEYFGPPIRNLNPVLAVQGRKFVLSPVEIGSLPLADLKEPVASLAAQADEILNAIDFMLRGF
ncbi:MAG: CcdB family protein [Panacagrimonas sp.]